MADGRRFSCKPIRANLDPRLTPGDHRVLDALGAHADTRTGEVTAGSQTLRGHARIGKEAMTERGFLKCSDHLEALGYVVTWREGIRKRYRVLIDEASGEVEATATGDTGTGVPPSIERDTGTGVPENRNGGSGDTGTGVPGERINSTNTDSTTTGAREPAQRNGGSGVTSTTGTDDTSDSIDQLAVLLAVAANTTLQANPRVGMLAYTAPMRPDMAIESLGLWLAEGIPFDLIRETVVRICAKYVPRRAGGRISTFTYFDHAVRDDWAAAQANADISAAAPSVLATTPVKKIRRMA